MPTSKVRVSEVSKFFQSSSRDHLAESTTQVHALDRINFTIEAGEIVALAGRSGCGKTTLLRIIMGLEVPTHGTVMVDGKTVQGCGHDRGIVFQHAELLPWRTALANAEFGLEVKGIPAAERREKALESLELVGLSDALDRRPGQLSGGMQQRLGLARALAIDPQVLLMDEPFGALDAQTREILQAELLTIHEKTDKTILFVTHDIDEAVLLADRVVVMSPNPGRVAEIVDINIPRPRSDVIAVRGSEEFAEKRYYIWRMLTETAVPA